jgi:hypothetical protein
MGLNEMMYYCSVVPLMIFPDTLSKASSEWTIMNSYSWHYLKTNHNLFFLLYPSQLISLHHPVIQQYLTSSFFSQPSSLFLFKVVLALFPNGKLNSYHVGINSSSPLLIRERKTDTNT